MKSSSSRNVPTLWQRHWVVRPLSWMSARVATVLREIARIFRNPLWNSTFSSPVRLILPDAKRCLERDEFELVSRDWGRDRCNQSAGLKSSERTRFYLSTAVSSSLQIRTIVVSKIRDLIQTVKFWWGWNQILRNEFFAKHDTALSPTSDSVVLCTVYVSM